MPYAPGITYDTQSLGSGIASAGESFAQGIREYAQNKKLDSTVTGQIEGYLNQASQSGGKGLSPGTQKLAEKLSQGKATLNDKLTLLGSLQTDNQLRTEAQQQQIRAVQLQQAQAAAQADAQARARLQQLSQYLNGAGSGVLKPQAQTALAAQANNPMMASAAKAYAATGDVPRADTLLANESREQIADLKAQHALEIFQLKQEHSGGYETPEAAVKAAKSIGANSVTVQQNSAGRWLANASFTDPSKASKMNQKDLQRSISLRAKMSQLTNIIAQMEAGSTNYPMSTKLPALEKELQTLQAEFDKLTEDDAPAPVAPSAPEVGGFTVRKSIPPLAK